MNNESRKQRLNALMKRRLELADFELEVNYNLACEPLSLLAGRVRTAGGAATIFVKTADGAAVLTADRGTADEKAEALDLSHEEWTSGEATIGMFLTLLERHHHGVILPDRFPDAGAITSMMIRNRSVALESMHA